VKADKPETISLYQFFRKEKMKEQRMRAFVRERVHTNDIVYKRLAPSMLDKLQSLNPVRPQGYGPPRIEGIQSLKEHLIAVRALMRDAPNCDAISWIGGCYLAFVMKALILVYLA